MTAEIFEHPKDGLIQWSVSRLSRETGFARETISARIEDYGIKPAGSLRGKPTYHLKDVGPAIFRNRAVEEVVNRIDDPSKLPPKERKDFYDSEKRRLEVEATKKLLIPAEVFRKELAAVCKAVALFMETLPDILERDCGLDPVTIDRIQQAADDQRLRLYRVVDEMTDAIESAGNE